MNQIGESHQGVSVWVFGQPHFDIRALGRFSAVLILDRIQDPKNLGAIIRTAWLMSVDCIFLSSRHTAFISPAVMKAANGGVSTCLLSD